MTVFNDGVLQSMLPNLKGRNEGMCFIAQETLTGSVTSVTFSSIDQGFTHLQIFASLRSDQAAESDDIEIIFNGDAGSIYDDQRLTASSTGVSAQAVRAQTAITIGTSEAASSRANSFGLLNATINNYTASIEHNIIGQSARFGDVSADTDCVLVFRAGKHRSAAAITSITIFPRLGTNYVSGCTFYLYGIL